MSKRSKPSLEDLIVALPDRTNKKEVWTLQEDAMLLKYGDSKGVPKLAEVMGKSKHAAHNRLRYLKGLK